jgi:hypothetical protein
MSELKLRPPEMQLHADPHGLKPLIYPMLFGMVEAMPGRKPEVVTQILKGHQHQAGCDLLKTLNHATLKSAYDKPNHGGQAPAS